MSNIIGEAIHFDAYFYDLDGYIRNDLIPNTDITLVSVRKPDGTVLESDPALTVSKVGNWYRVTVLGTDVDTTGTWRAEFDAVDDEDVSPLNLVVPVEVESADSGGGGDPEAIATAVAAAFAAGRVAFLRTNVLMNGNIDKLVKGDTYSVENGTAIEFIIPPNLPYDLTNATMKLRVRRRKTKIVIDDIPVSLITAGSEKRLRFELSTDDTGKLEVNDNIHQFAIRATWGTPNMSPKTIFIGDIEHVYDF